MPEESSGEDVSVIENKKVTRHEITAELAERGVIDPAAAVKDE